jgi:hypothetical protein
MFPKFQSPAPPALEGGGGGGKPEFFPVLPRSIYFEIRSTMDGCHTSPPPSQPPPFSSCMLYAQTLSTMISSAFWSLSDLRGPSLQSAVIAVSFSILLFFLHFLSSCTFPVPYNSISLPFRSLLVLSLSVSVRATSYLSRLSLPLKCFHSPSLPVLSLQFSINHSFLSHSPLLSCLTLPVPSP